MGRSGGGGCKMEKTGAEQQYHYTVQYSSVAPGCSLNYILIFSLGRRGDGKLTWPEREIIGSASIGPG